MLRLAARPADIVGGLPAPIKSSQDDDDDPAARLPPAWDAKLAVLRDAATDTATFRRLADERNMAVLLVEHDPPVITISPSA